VIRSKRHNGRRLRALHMYNAPMSPPPWSSKAWWSGRWDLQHDGVVLMVESICGQGFAYVREVEEDRQKTSQTRARGETADTRRLNKFICQKRSPRLDPSFIPGSHPSWSKGQAIHRSDRCLAASGRGSSRSFGRSGLPAIKLVERSAQAGGAVFGPRRGLAGPAAWHR
jgi:hypothetical protein